MGVSDDPRLSTEERRRLLRERRQDKANANLQAAGQTEPDSFARGLALDDTMGLPAGAGQKLVQHGDPGMLDAVENGAQGILRTTPMLQGWMQRPDHAAVGRDDIPALHDVSRTVSGFGDVLLGSGEMGVRRQAADGLLALGFQRLMAPAEVEAAVRPHLAEIAAIRRGMPSYIGKQAEKVQAASERLNVAAQPLSELAGAFETKDVEPHTITIESGGRFHNLDLGRGEHQMTRAEAIAAFEASGKSDAGFATRAEARQAAMAARAEEFAALNKSVPLGPLLTAAAGSYPAIAEATPGLIEAYTENQKYFAAQTAEQLPNSALSILAATTTALLTRNPRATLTAMGTGEFISEYGSYLEEQANNAGLDLSKPGVITKLLSDPALVDNFNKHAGLKALGTTVADMMIEARIGKDVARAVERKFGAAKVPFVQKVVAGLAEVLAATPKGMLGESFSEFTGEVATGQVDPASVITEGLASPLSEAGMIGVMSAVNKTASAAKTAALASPRVVKEVIDTVRAQEDAETLTQAADALGKSKAFKRAPELVKRLVRAASAGGDAGTVYVSLQAWNEIFDRSKGADPLRAALETSKKGAAIYAEAAGTAGKPGTGTLAFPTEDFLASVGQDQQAFQALMPYSRMRAGGPTFQEAETGLQQIAEQIKNVGKVADDVQGKMQELAGVDEEIVRLEQGPQLGQEQPDGHWRPLAEGEELGPDRQVRTTVDGQREVWEPPPGAVEQPPEQTLREKAETGAQPKGVQEQVDHLEAEIAQLRDLMLRNPDDAEMQKSGAEEIAGWRQQLQDLAAQGATVSPEGQERSAAVQMAQAPVRSEEEMKQAATEFTGEAAQAPAPGTPVQEAVKAGAAMTNEAARTERLATLKQRRQQLAAEIQQLAGLSTDEEQQIKERYNAQLLAAGRPATEADVGSRIIARLIGTFSRRYKLSMADLEKKIRVAQPAEKAAGAQIEQPGGESFNGYWIMPDGQVNKLPRALGEGGTHRSWAAKQGTSWAELLKQGAAAVRAYAGNMAIDVGGGKDALTRAQQAVQFAVEQGERPQTVTLAIDNVDYGRVPISAFLAARTPQAVRKASRDALGGVDLYQGGQLPDPGQWYFSYMLKQVTDMPEKTKLGPDQWIKTLKNKGVKEEEFKWLNLERGLWALAKPSSQAKPRTLSRSEVAQYIAENQIHVREKLLGQQPAPPKTSGNRTTRFDWPEMYDDDDLEEAVENFTDQSEERWRVNYEQDYIEGGDEEMTAEYISEREERVRERAIENADTYYVEEEEEVDPDAEWEDGRPEVREVGGNYLVEWTPPEAGGFETGQQQLIPTQIPERSYTRTRVFSSRHEADLFADDLIENTEIVKTVWNVHRPSGGVEETFDNEEDADQYATEQNDDIYNSAVDQAMEDLKNEAEQATREYLEETAADRSAEAWAEDGRDEVFAEVKQEGEQVFARQRAQREAAAQPPHELNLNPEMAGAEVALTRPEPTPSAPTRYERYLTQTPRGTNYRELLLTLPPSATRTAVAGEERYNPSHFTSNQDILAHVLFDEQKTADGKRVLFIQEMQSDWHTTGRHGGYREMIPEPAPGETPTPKKVGWLLIKDGAEVNWYPTETEAEGARAALARGFPQYTYSIRHGNPTPGSLAETNHAATQQVMREYGLRGRRAQGQEFTPGTVPDAPFKGGAWQELVLKRMLRWAAEHGYDAVSWPQGEMIARRYSLSQHIDELRYFKNPDGTYKLEPIKGGRVVQLRDDVSAIKPEALDTHVGQALAQKIREGSGDPVYQRDISTSAESRTPQSRLNGAIGGVIVDLNIDTYPLDEPNKAWELADLLEGIGATPGEFVDGTQLGEGATIHSRRSGFGMPRRADEWDNHRLVLSLGNNQYYGWFAQEVNQQRVRNTLTALMEAHKRVKAAMAEDAGKPAQEEQPVAHTIKGISLDVGGATHKRLYNTIVPSTAAKLVKPWGGKVETVMHGPSPGGGMSQYGPYTVEVLGGDTFRVLNRNGTAVETHGTREDADAAAAERNAAAGPGAPIQGVLITPEMRKDIIEHGFRLMQEAQAGGPRGATNIGGYGSNKVYTIQFFEGANRSTWFHELGHTFLDIMGELAQAPDAPQQLKEDYQTALDAMGTNHRDLSDRLAEIARIQAKGALSDDDKATIAELSKPLETWAKLFEAYLREGKAPTPGLRRVFATLKGWLTSIYQTLTGLGVNLTPEVRAVMDRMLATDEELLAAQQEEGGVPAFTEKPAGMTDEQWTEYQRAIDERLDVAREKMLRALLADESRAKKEVREDRLEGFRKQVRKQVEALPAAQALKQMQGQGEGPAFKLTRSSVEALLGKGSRVLKELDKLGLLSDQGVHVDNAAELFGEESGEKLARDIVALGNRDRFIERQARAMLDAAFPELMSRERVRGMARQLRETHDELAVQKEELDVLNALVGAEGRTRREEMTPAIGVTEARGVARDSLSHKPLAEVKPHVYRQMSQRESRLSNANVKGGSWVDAGQAKQREIVTGAMAQVGTKILAKAERDVRAMRGLQSPGRQEKAGLGDPIYRKQMNRLLANFGLGAVTADELADTKPFAQWIADLEKAARQPNSSTIVPIVPEWLLAAGDTALNWRQLSSIQLTELRDVSEQLYEISRNKYRALAGQKRQTLLERAERVASQIIASAQGKKLDRGFQQRPSLGRRYVAEHSPIDRYVAEIDGEPGGPLFEAFLQLRNEGEEEKSRLRIEVNKALDAALKHFTAAERASFGIRREVPGIAQKISHEQRLILALYQGTETGRQRNAVHWSPAEIDAILRTLTPRDAAWLNDIWKLQEGFWPRSKALMERVWGVASEKLPATPFTVINNEGERLELTGGYTKLKYFGEAAHEITLQEMASRIGRGADITPRVRMGSRFNRLEIVDKAPRYDLGVVMEGLGETIQALSFLERLHDMNAVLMDPRVSSAMKEYRGQEVYDQFRDAFTAIGVGRLGVQSAVEQSAAWFRAGTVISMMGFKVATNLVNMSGIMSSAAALGPDVLAEAARLNFNPKAFYDAVMEMWEEAPAMKQRADHFNREQADVREQLNKRFGSNALQGVPMLPMAFTQLWVDLPTYRVAKAKALSEGHSQKQAIAIAVQEVKRIQGSGLAGDIPKVMRDHKMWTIFMGFLNRQLNLSAEFVHKTDFSNPAQVAKLAVQLFTQWMIPAAFMVAVSRLRGDKDRDPFWLTTLYETLYSVLGGAAGVREVASALRLGRDYSGTADNAIYDQFGDLVDALRNRRWDQRDVEEAAKLLGILAHLPTQQPIETWKGLQMYMAGRAGPQAILLGPPRRRR